MWFYFRPRWRDRWAKFLPAIYLICIVLAASDLFTNFLLAGAQAWDTLQLIGPIPGPLMNFFFIFFYVVWGLSIISLIGSYRSYHSPTMRRQIMYMLSPFILIVLVSIVNWCLVLTRIEWPFMFETANFLLLITAFMYGKAVLQYGTFVGRPQAGSLFMLC